MILSGPMIDNQVKAGIIHIEPYDPTNLNPASIDLTLGSEVAVYDKWVWPPPMYEKAHKVTGRHDKVLDSREEPKVTKFQIPEDGLVLQPNLLYLMHTCERVYTEQFVPVLDGKSSLGRLGILIHFTAGYGDPGFDGQYTLEVTSVHRVKIYTGMRFCQMRFHALVDGDNPHISYQGNYRGAAATGPVPSKAYKQFKDKKP